MDEKTQQIIVIYMDDTYFTVKQLKKHNLRHDSEWTLSESIWASNYYIMHAHIMRAKHWVILWTNCVNIEPQVIESVLTHNHHGGWRVDLSLTIASLIGSNPALETNTLMDCSGKVVS